MARVNMRMDLFAKEKSTKDGSRKFKVYFGKLNGHPVNVKFPESVKAPSITPCTIEIHEANCATKEYQASDGTTGINKVVWVKEYEEFEYVDYSMDEFNEPPKDDEPIPFE